MGEHKPTPVEAGTTRESFVRGERYSLRRQSVPSCMRILSESRSSSRAFFFFKEPAAHQDLPSSPPRRSPDLLGESRRRLVTPPNTRGSEAVSFSRPPPLPHLKRDWRARAVDVAMATAAAPTYLPGVALD